MTIGNDQQFCAICAWRENCAKKFCVPDGGARCPDYTRDVTIKSTSTVETDDSKNTEEQ